LYASGKEVRLFELRSHEDLVDEPLRESRLRASMVWVEPAIPPERAQLIKNKCRLVHLLHKTNAIPYGFRYSHTAFDPQGSLRLGSGEVGLTCATVIDAVFASEGMPLLDPTTWPPPDDDDKRSRKVVIDDIRTKHPEHATALEADIDAPRIRPEEVVAAAAMHPVVATYEKALDGAAVVTDRLGFRAPTNIRR
jgi:hypothetical protein